MDREKYHLMYEVYRVCGRERTRYFCRSEQDTFAGANRHFCYVKLCYSYTMVVDKVMYYVYTMGVVMMMYHKEVFHVEVYCEDMYCEGVYYVKYVGVLDYYQVYCELGYYKVDNWVQKVEILVLDEMMYHKEVYCEVGYYKVDN